MGAAGRRLAALETVGKFVALEFVGKRFVALEFMGKIFTAFEFARSFVALEIVERLVALEVMGGRLVPDVGGLMAIVGRRLVVLEFI